MLIDAGPVQLRWARRVTRPIEAPVMLSKTFKRPYHHVVQRCRLVVVQEGESVISESVEVHVH